MTVTVSAIRKRLDSCSSVLELIERDKERIYKILRFFGKMCNGIGISDVKKGYLGKGGPLNFSNTHFVASIGWLKNNGYLTNGKGKKHRKPIFLSEKGRKALHQLDDYLSSPQTCLKITWNLTDDKEVEARLDGNLQDTVKTAIFSREFIRNRILELSATLLFLPEKINLTIKIPATKRTKIFVLLKFLWSFYWQTVTETGIRPSLFGPLYVNMHLTDKKGKEVYTEFWKKHLETRLSLEGTMYEFGMIHGEKSWIKKGPLFPLLPRELEHFPLTYLEDAEVKQWIESRLEKDADWFMPHYFWVELGFKRRREDLSVDSVDHVSPPYFHEITSPKLPEEYGNFDSMIKYLVRKEDEESIKALCIWIAKTSHWRNQDFYKSWRILRKEYKEKIDEDLKFRDVARILDEAFCEYIIAEDNPNVDLQSALNDYLVSNDVESVVVGIKRGKYRLHENLAYVR